MTVRVTGCKVGVSDVTGRGAESERGREQMRAILRIECDPQGSWGSNGSEAQDSRAFTWHVLRKITDAMPDYVEWSVIVGAEDSEVAAAVELKQAWVAAN